MKKEQSEHFHVLEKWIEEAISIVYEECSATFKEACNVQVRPSKKLFPAIEEEYRKQRSALKKECYRHESGNGFLDARKIAAVVCKALVREKVFSFDEQAALQLLSEKKDEIGNVEGQNISREQLNCWIVDNYFLNYKVAYLSSLIIVFNVLLEELAHDGKDIETAKKLGELGSLYKYPDSEGFDCFDINIVIGLGRADMQGREIDSFMFAMTLYQMEMYTLLQLKK